MSEFHVLRNPHLVPLLYFRAVEPKLREVKDSTKFTTWINIPISQMRKLRLEALEGHSTVI